MQLTKKSYLPLILLSFAPMPALAQTVDALCSAILPRNAPNAQACTDLARFSYFEAGAVDVCAAILQAGSTDDALQALRVSANQIFPPNSSVICSAIALRNQPNAIACLSKLAGSGFYDSSAQSVVAEILRVGSTTDALSALDASRGISYQPEAAQICTAIATRNQPNAVRCLQTVANHGFNSVDLQFCSARLAAGTTDDALNCLVSASTYWGNGGGPGHLPGVPNPPAQPVTGDGVASNPDVCEITPFPNTYSVQATLNSRTLMGAQLGLSTQYATVDYGHNLQMIDLIKALSQFAHAGNCRLQAGACSLTVSSLPQWYAYQVNIGSAQFSLNGQPDAQDVLSAAIAAGLCN